MEQVAIGLDLAYSISCIACGTCLTDDEVMYYGNTCDNCERENMQRHQDYLDGKEDTELDEWYSSRT